MQAFNVTLFCERFLFFTQFECVQHSHIRVLLNFFGQEGLRPHPPSPKVPVPLCVYFYDEIRFAADIFSSLNRAEINFLYELDTKFFTLG